MTEREIPERVVHARGDFGEVVRYNKSGKWFIEPFSDEFPRIQVKVDQAVDQGIWLWYFDNGTVNFDRPGGAVFNRKVRSRII